MLVSLGVARQPFYRACALRTLADEQGHQLWPTTPCVLQTCSEVVYRGTDRRVPGVRMLPELHELLISARTRVPMLAVCLLVSP